MVALKDRYGPSQLDITTVGTYGIEGKSIGALAF